MPPVRKSNPRRWLPSVLCACIILAVAFLAVHSTAGDLAGNVGYSHVAKVPKDFRFNAKGQPDLALSTSAKNWTPAFNVSFLKSDRKQNLLEWPVLALGLIRSPPVKFSF